MTLMDSFRTPTALGSRPRSRVPVTISSTRSIIFIHSSFVNGGTKSDPALLWLWEALVQKMLGVDPAERALRHPIPVPGTRCPRGAGRETLIAPAASTAGQMIWDKFESLRRRAPHQLQIDFPMLVSRWDTASRTMSLAEYRKWAEERIAYLNHALRGLPEDRIRFHTCYGVNFGPRVSDLQLENLIDLIFTIKAGAYSFEAANPRHEHEWRVLEKVKLPDGKILIPGAVTHSNVMIEHPEVVADRIERWARIAGRENLVFGNDCGFQSTAGNTEIPITVAWAKLRALGEGARIASQRLWL